MQEGSWRALQPFIHFIRLNLRNFKSYCSVQRLVGKEHSGLGCFCATLSNTGCDFTELRWECCALHSAWSNQASDNCTITEAKHGAYRISADNSQKTGSRTWRTPKMPRSPIFLHIFVALSETMMDIKLTGVDSLWLFDPPWLHKDWACHEAAPAISASLPKKHQNYVHCIV